ncbi:hypothetical protein AGMMS49982_10280 [Bacteroidia bacterium]|nr:hypothetical protein AGMMS49982_10280 [Bacteroidia bacterium]
MKTSTEKMYVNVPQQDVNLLRKVAEQYGWEVTDRNTLWDNLRRSLPAKEPDITDKEIMAEVRAVRYGEV